MLQHGIASLIDYVSDITMDKPVIPNPFTGKTDNPTVVHILKDATLCSLNELREIVKTPGIHISAKIHYYIHNGYPQYRFCSSSRSNDVVSLFSIEIY